jgi:hypothetical protein
MKKLLYISLIATSVLLAGLGCKRQEPKPDPCKDIKPLSADFMISEVAPYDDEDWKDNDTDTIGTYRAKFTATCEYCEYEWTLGAETIRTRSFVRTNFPLNSPIEVSLKVKAKNLPRNYFDCVKDRKLEDEKTRTFVNVKPGRRYLGKFYGADTDRPNEPYMIEVYMIVSNPGYSNETEDIYIKGLVKPNCDCGTIDSYIVSGFQQSLLPSNCTGECMKPIVLFNFETNEEVTITYHLFGEYDWDIKDRPKIATKTFKGRRIQ